MSVPAKPKKAGQFGHGLYARDFLLPWEDREGFEALHAELKEEFFPKGVSEEECVLDLAQLHWQKRTLWRLRTAAVVRDRFTEEIVATGKKSWGGFARVCVKRRAKSIRYCKALRRQPPTGFPKWCGRCEN